MNCDFQSYQLFEISCDCFAYIAEYLLVHLPICIAFNFFASFSSFALTIVLIFCLFYLIFLVLFVFTPAFKLLQECKTCIINNKMKYKYFYNKKNIKYCIHYKGKKDSCFSICYIIVMVLFYTNYAKYYITIGLKLTK